MNPLDLLFQQIAGQIQNHSSPNTPGPTYDPSSLINSIGSLFGQHAQESGQDFSGIASSDQDPYGDPGATGQQATNVGAGNIASSDEDPYGDPGATGQQASNAAYGKIESSDADPYGDPGLQQR